MNVTDEYKRKLHYMMAFIGGFMGMYAILNRCDLFGNAQTVNMIYIVMNLVGRNFFGIICRLGGLFLYMAGIVLTVLWPKDSKISLHYVSVAVDGIAFIILGFLPKHMNNVIALYPIFFAMAFQWNSFPGVFGYNCSTIFSTNNLRQFTVASTEYLCSKESKHAHKAKFYGGTLLCYHLGVAVSYLSHLLLAIRSAWIGILPVSLAAVMVIYENSAVFHSYFSGLRPRNGV